MARYENTPVANGWYYIVNAFTFGTLYFVKIAVKKALSEVTTTPKVVAGTPLGVNEDE